MGIADNPISSFTVDLDRIEEGIAVILAPGGFQWHLPSSFLPGNAGEGDCLQVTLELNSASTSSRMERIEDLRRKLESK